MNLSFPRIGAKKITYAISALVMLYVLYIVLIGSIASTYSDSYEPQTLESDASDKDKALIMANAVTHSINNQLESITGFVPNDLLGVPYILDNITSYQKGIVYATRPASDVVTKAISRYGQNDTIDKRLSDASYQEFVYGPEVWGFFVRSSESQYKSAVTNWMAWANSVDSGAKNAGIYNVKSDDVYQILKYCSNMLEYSVGLLNKDNLTHFEIDNTIYYTKGIASVVENVLKGLIAVDSSVVERGGAENVEQALKRLNYVGDFNPLYIFAGGNDIGDAMLPNHVAAIARHLDIASNRITDIMNSMEK